MKQKTKDNLIYLGVGLAIAAGFTIYMFYTERTTGKIQEIPGPILWGILCTPGIVALIFERFWQFRRRPWLWVISVVAASVNLSAMFVAYSFRWNPPVVVWSGMTVVQKASRSTREFQQLWCAHKYL
jgi:drug/metabolite transporter (DMT)-like permease